MKELSVSAIVLNYKMPKDTVLCVRALLRQTMAGDIEIFIVDNHSENDSIGFLRNTFKNVTLSEDEGRKVRFFESARNGGYGKGNALGIAAAKGKYILIINPDNELEPSALEQMTAAMERDPQIGILGPKLLHEDGSIRDSYRTFPTLSDIFIKRTFLRRFFPTRMGRYLQHHQDHSQVRDVDWMAGACLLMRRDFFHTLGGFDPRFFLFFEDTDLCRRCWLAGKRVVYFPVVHATDRKHRLSEGGLFSIFTKKTVRIHLASAVKYFWKWRRAS